MIIGIDASRAFLGERTGIEEYAYNLIFHLRDSIPATHKVVLYVRSQQYNITKHEYFPIPAHWEVREIPFKRFWTHAGLSLEMLRRSPDVLFIPAHTVPVIHPKKTLVTIHGLEYEQCPSAYSLFERVYMRALIRFSCRQAQRVVAVSESTKRALSSWYGISKKKITVVYEGCGSSESKGVSVEKRKRILEKFGILKHPFILCVGRVEERKNIIRIVHAFELFQRSMAVSYQLVIAGKRGYGYERIRNVIEGSACREHIRETGYVSKEEKLVLFQSSKCLLFLSLAEGFGLPVLEAQQLGVPAVVSDIPAISEIAGEGAFVVSPFDEKEMAEAMLKAVSQNEERNDILKKGTVNASKFSWSRCAQEITQLLLK